MRWEDEEPPTGSAADAQAIQAWNALTNGTGGIDWAGLPLVAELLGIDDLEDLLHRLLVIKLHRPPKDDLPST